MKPLHDIAETAAALGQDDLAAQIREWAGEVRLLRMQLAAVTDALQERLGTNSDEWVLVQGARTLLGE